MPSNPQRRRIVLDAAIAVLAEAGARGLTHRSVDARAGVPEGTTANYFRRRSDLLLSMATRSFERLAPEAARLEKLAALRGRDAQTAYVEYVVERLLRERDVMLALYELRLEAARNPDVRDAVAPFLRAGLEADVAFAAERALPGGRDDVLALHYAVEGLVFDRLTVPLDPEADVKVVARDLVRRLGSALPPVAPYVVQ